MRGSEIVCVCVVWVNQGRDSRDLSMFHLWVGQWFAAFLQ